MDNIKIKEEETEIDNSGTETPILNQPIVIVNEQSVSVIVKEFDFNRFQAIRLLKQNDGDLQKTIRFILSN